MKAGSYGAVPIGTVVWFLWSLHIPTQVGPIGQPLLAGQLQILFDPPEQRRTGLSPLGPQGKAIEIPVGQTQHPGTQRG